MGFFKRKKAMDNGDGLAAYIDERLESVKTLEDALKLFKEMCRIETSSEMDMKLFQYGIWSWTDYRLFEIGFVRQLQFPYTQDEYCQVELVASFPANDQLKELGKKAFWDEEIEGDFYEAIRRDKAFALLKDAEPEKITVTCQTT